MLITTGKDLRKIILLDPPKEKDCDEIRILSGYATASMASKFIELLGERADSVTIKMIVGMASADGIVDIQHKNFKKLMEERKGRFECSYIMISHAPCHAKTYIWLKNGIPVKAFTGSANFTQNAFYGRQHEMMEECDPQSALAYFDLFSSKAIYCTHSEVEDTVKIISREQYRFKNAKIDEISGETDERTFFEEMGVPFKTLSLLTTQGAMGTTSSLNWGQRDSRNRDQAYIPMQRSVARSGFFPKKESHFTVITDDGISLICSVAQGDEDGKAIHTPLDNAELGRYFRKRIGVPSGAYVNKEDLERYGRTDVTFFKIDEETYHMDFSVRR